MKATVVIADDHPLLLEGTQQFLKNKGYKIVATATNGNDAYNKILKYQPNIAVLDFDMPNQNGIEIAKLCKQNNISVKIIILTLYKEEEILKEANKSIHGYILKNNALTELEICLKEVLKGNIYISKNIENNIHLSSKKASIKNLTISEIKILKYLAKNKSSSDIADALFISRRTVEKHRSNIIAKLGIESSQNGLLLWVQKNPEIFNT